MTTPDAQSVLVAVARLEAKYEALMAQLGRMDARRESGRNDLLRQIAVVQDQQTSHQRRRDGEIAEIKRDQKEMRDDIAEIREALAGGTATRQFIVLAAGIAAAAATVIGVVTSLVAHHA